MLITAKSKRVIFVAGMFVLSLCASPVHADDPKIIHVAGKAELIKAKGAVPVQATVGASLKPGSKIVVVGKGIVEIKVGKESINATAGDDTLLEYSGRSYFKSVERFTLQKGRALFKIKKGDKLDVKTPHVVASVRGTEFIAHAEKNRSSISVVSGSVRTKDYHGNSLELNADSYAVVDDKGFVEVGKGRRVNGITGKVGPAMGNNVNADNKSSAGQPDPAKSNAAKGGKNKKDSQKATSGKSGAGRGAIGKDKADKGDSGKGKKGGNISNDKNARGGKSSKGQSGGGKSAAGMSGGGNAGGGSSGGGDSDGGSAGGGNDSGGNSGGDNGSADGGNDGGGNSKGDGGSVGQDNDTGGKSGKGKSGKGKSGKGNSGKWGSAR